MVYYSPKEGDVMRNIIGITAFLILILCVGGFAGNNPETKVAVHVRAHNAPLGCDYGTITDCHDFVVTELGPDVDAFPVFFDVAEFRGCEYGMWWHEWTSSAVFTNCADFVIGSITWPGDGVSHAWQTCQTGSWVCVPCFIWLYADSPGLICVVPHPISGVVAVLDCAEGLDAPYITFCAGVYGYVGDDPCPPVSESRSTWGGVKDMFD
jgi:hypothetical protein